MNVFSPNLLAGKSALVTGGGSGIGAGIAKTFARHGAKVALVGRTAAKLEAVATEIRAAGGEAIANGADVADFAATGALVAATIDAFGRLDVVVNNAGFVRDRMFVSCSEEEWDAVQRVHLKGHFCISRHACDHWRAESKAGRAVDARIINTTSGAGLMGSVGQAAYSAAKGGIVSLTLVQAAELARYGVTANAIAPAARTRMTEKVFADTMAVPDDPNAFDEMAADNVAPLVVWLGAIDSAGVTGRVFEVEGGKVSVADGWRHGTVIDKGARWEPIEVGAAVTELLAAAPDPTPVYGAG